jgi:hypothetical protein
MNRTVVKLVIALAALSFAPAIAVAQASSGKSHLLLLDVSGSMQSRYSNNLRDWLVGNLIASSVFSPSDRVVVRWFNDQGGAAFQQTDPLRKYDGRHDRQQILAALPQQVTPYDTDIPKALDQALADIRGLPLSNDVFIWLITDNVQDAGAGATIDPLYQKIVAEKNIRAAYIFPLLKENGRQIAAGQTAMVMYLLHYSAQASTLNVNSIADDAGRKISNDPVTWFPFEEQIHLEQSNITVNGQAAQFVDGKLALPALGEGRAPQFAIRFKLRSQLRGQEITSGKITRPLALIDHIPSSVETEGDQASLRASVLPPTISLKSRQRSTGEYTAEIKADNLTFQATSFWNALWNSESAPVEAVLQMSPADIQTRMDLQTISPVPDLDRIQKIVRQGQSGSRPIRVPVKFQIEFNSLWRRAVAALAALAALGAMAGLAGVFLVRAAYQLITPEGERGLSLPLIGSHLISIDGRPAAQITRRFGRLSVAPQPGFLIEGGLIARKMDREGGDFMIESEQDHLRQPYSISRALPASSQRVARDDILD